MGKNLIILTGPTAVGKTDLSIELSKWLGTEIISSDSRQMYRQMNIGTAKPTPVELSMVPHHFINNLDISDYYNASKFEIEALELLEKLFVTNDQVLVSGGSTLYVTTLMEGIDDLPSIDFEIRDLLQQKYQKVGLEGLQKELERLDPVHYAIVELKNPQRVLKALEVCYQTGQPYSSFMTQCKRERPFNLVKVALTRNRAELYDRINQRVDIMVKDGLEQEALDLYPFKHLNALNTVGYREWFDYFNGTCDRETAIELIKRNSRRYAKRQLTWFMRDKEFTWFDPRNTDEIKKHIESQLI